MQPDYKVGDTVHSEYNSIHASLLCPVPFVAMKVKEVDGCIVTVEYNGEDTQVDIRVNHLIRLH